MRRWVLPFLALVVAACTALAAGPAAFGRLALSTGLPGLAASLTTEPAVRGVALYRAGRYEEADLAFRAAGSEATYNRGLGLAALGRYAEAVAYFDAVLFADPSDADARFNRALVAARIDPVVGESNDIDGIAANIEAEDAAAQPTKRDVPKALTLAEQRSVVRPRTGQGVVASEDWLTTLPDDPGAFLKLRLRAEHQRRQDLGLANPPEDTAW